MKARPVWKGTIHFGLVSIPIEMYSAIQPHVLGFKLLHAECNSPISNKRWCAHCEKEVAWEDTLKGLKLPDGSFFLVTQENLKKLKPEKTDTIDIIEFVDIASVSPIYYDQHYYIVPQKASDRAFFLFGAALGRFHQSAIGRFVMRDKEYTCLLQPFKNAILLSTLNYDYEIKRIEQVEHLKIPARVNEQELKLAQLLISKLYSKTFDISEFKDSFALKLAQAIKAHQKGKVIKIEKPKTVKAPAVSLMKALKDSLGKKEEAAERRRSR